MADTTYTVTDQNPDFLHEWDCDCPQCVPDVVGWFQHTWADPESPIRQAWARAFGNFWHDCRYHGAWTLILAPLTLIVALAATYPW